MQCTFYSHNLGEHKTSELEDLTMHHTNWFIKLIMAVHTESFNSSSSAAQL